MQAEKTRKTRGPSLDEMIEAGELAEDREIEDTNDPVNRAQKMIMRGEGRLLVNLPSTVILIIKSQSWEGRTKQVNGETLPIISFQDLVETRLPWGLESTIDDLMTYCRKNEEAMCLIRSQIEAAGNVGAPVGNRNAVKAEENKGSNTTIERKQDRSQKYAISRLKRDRPDLAQKVISGDMTANEAAIEAGFRKRMVSMPAEPDQFIEAAQKLLHKRVLLLDESNTDYTFSTAADPVETAHSLVEEIDTDWLEAFLKALNSRLPGMGAAK